MQMAKNLRERLPKSSTLYINDVVPTVLDKFVAEYSNLGPVVVCDSAAQIVAKSVGTSLPTPGTCWH